MKSDKRNLLAELKNAIGKQITPAAAPPPQPASKAAEERHFSPKNAGVRAAHPSKGREAAKVTIRRGRGVQFYLDDADRKLISNLALWFGSQDRRVSDSQVIKAAIRFASGQTNARLLEICDEVRAGDRRRHARNPKKGSESQ